LKATQLNSTTAMILSVTVRPKTARALNGDGGLAALTPSCCCDVTVAMAALCTHVTAI